MVPTDGESVCVKVKHELGKIVSFQNGGEDDLQSKGRNEVAGCDR